jgi:hypothetical protein
VADVFFLFSVCNPSKPLLGQRIDPATSMILLFVLLLFFCFDFSPVAGKCVLELEEKIHRKLHDSFTIKCLSGTKIMDKNSSVFALQEKLG